MHMNIRTILIAGSLSLLALSPLQAQTEAVVEPAVVETPKPAAKTDAVQTTDAPATENKEARSEAAAPAPVQSDKDRNVTMSVGTILLVLLLIIILL